VSEKAILIVDDEEAIRKVFSKAFEKSGFTVRVAESAEKAEEILQKESIMLMLLD
jgi:DNA-binding NtrC family response regulator